jgi:O-antigen ligase
MMKHHPVTGIGYKNWMKYVQAHYPPWRAEGSDWDIYQLPHNIFIEAGAELGYTGLLLFCGLIGMTFYTNRKTRKLAKQFGEEGVFAFKMAKAFDVALVGYMVAGFFVTVLYYPFFWINYSLTVALHTIVMRRASAAAARNVTPQRRMRGNVHVAM